MPSSCSSPSGWAVPASSPAPAIGYQHMTTAQADDPECLPWPAPVLGERVESGWRVLALPRP
jgi:hypothetical protein